MRLVFTSSGWEDFLHWQSIDRQMSKRVNRLLTETIRQPFEGIGKPEQLKHLYAGAWSRRIDDEHRLVYLVENDDLIVLQARYHY